MAIDFALFLSPDGIALAHRQREGHWAFIGETSLDVPDLGHRLSALREVGDARAGAGFGTLLILPNEQILYTDLQIDPDSADLRAAVGRGLDGRTPYALSELAFDYRMVAPDRVQVAAVAQTTLTEAMDFARSAGFNGVGFGATPAAADFPGVPIFELDASAGPVEFGTTGIAMGPDTWSSDWENADARLSEPQAGFDEPARVFEHAVEEAPADIAPPSEPDPEPFEAVFEAEPERDLPEPADATVSLEDAVAFATEDAPREAAEDTAIHVDADAGFDLPEATETDADADTHAVEDPQGSLPENEVAEQVAADQSTEGTDFLTAFRRYTSSRTDDVPAEPEPNADVSPDETDSPLPEDAWEAAHAVETGEAQWLEPDATPELEVAAEIAPEIVPEIAADPEAEAPAPEPEPEPEPEPAIPDMAAAMSYSDDQAASFLTEEHVEELAPPVLDDADVQEASAVELDLSLEDAAAARLVAETAELPAPDVVAEVPVEPVAEAPAPTPKVSRTPKRRTARIPALFAGGGQPHEEPSPVRSEPVLSEPAPAPAPAASLESPAPEAPSVADDALVNDPIPDMPLGLAERIRQRRAEAEDPEASGATFAFRRTPALPALSTAGAAPRRIEMDDAILSGGVLARRNDQTARPSLRTALVLTVVLILLLALVAVWSALFLPESRVAQLFGRVAPEVETPEPAPIDNAAEPASDLAPLPQGDPDADAPQDVAEDAPALDPPIFTPEPLPEFPALQTGDADGGAADDGTSGPDSPLDVAAVEPDPAPEPQLPPVAARVPPPSLEEAELEYATFGIWQLAPAPPAAPTRDFLIPEPGETVRLAAIDPFEASAAAVALARPTTPVAPRAQASPPPFGSALSQGIEVAPTPEGVITPDGAFVVLGTPSVTAQPRPGPVPAEAVEGPGAVQTAAAGLTDATLVAFPPTQRPDGLVDAPAADVLASATPDVTPDIPDALRPAVRPGTAPELADTATDAEITDEDTGGSELAIATSPQPVTRPSTINAAVAAALANVPAGNPSTASLAAPEPVAPPTVEPDIPTNASVSRSATVENVIDLGEINLIGVRGTPDNRVALVRLASGRFVEVGVGDRLDGGRVAAIGADSLQYVRGNRNFTLEAPSG